MEILRVFLEYGTGVTGKSNDTRLLTPLTG